MEALELRIELLHFLRDGLEPFVHEVAFLAGQDDHERDLDLFHLVGLLVLTRLAAKKGQKAGQER